MTDFQVDDRVRVIAARSSFRGELGTIRRCAKSFAGYQLLAVEVDGTNDPRGIFFHPRELEVITEGQVSA